MRDSSDCERYDGVIVTAAVRDEGTTTLIFPLNIRQWRTGHVVEQLSRAALAKKLNYAEGISQSKDSFYGEIDPDCSPVSGLLKERWRACSAET